MRLHDSVFSSLLKPIDRRAFRTIVERHGGDAYDKSFRSWDHLVALLFAQFSRVGSLRGLEVAFNANAHCHYHLGTGPLARATLADANARRPVAVFAELFALLSAQIDRKTRREGRDMLRLIDSTPIPLGKLCAFATSNGRIRGLKMHVVYDPLADRPMTVDITPANVNDVEIGRQIPIEVGAAYVFDKGYCHYGWWTAIARAGATFVTRPKTNVKFAVVETRTLGQTRGDCFAVASDCEVALASKGDSKLPIRLRRVEIERDDAKPIVLITNDMSRLAVEIGALYKARWGVELLFRWIKQHLEIRRFLGRNENAVRVQIVAAMIAFVLLRLAAKLHRLALPALRFAELVATFLFARRALAAINKPPPKPAPRKTANLHDQYQLAYA